MAIQQPPYGLARASLTRNQKQLISDTLSEYDANNLTRKDIFSIVSTFADTGILPGRELAELMETAGFDARLVGGMAGIQESPTGQEMVGGQANGNGFNLSEELIQDLYTLLDQYYAEDTTDDQHRTLMKSFQDLLGPEDSMLSIWVLKIVCSAYLYRIMYSS